MTDTIGFCDTEFSEEKVFNLIKDRVSSNMNKLNLVVFVIRSGRLDLKFQETIKKTMEWLDYPSNSGRFHFIITHCEHNLEEENNKVCF